MRAVYRRLAGSGALLFLAISLPVRAADPPAHVPGRLLVSLRSGVDAHLLAQTLTAHRAVTRKHWAQINVLEVPEESSEAIKASLERTGLFEYVEHDQYAQIAETPNDPNFVSQWHLTRIQTPQAWDLTTGSPSVVVAVIDSGAFAAHPDLAPNLMPGWNFVKSNADTADALGHGTAVSGTIAAAANNGVGGAGVSWQSRIMPLVVVDEDNLATYSDIAQAIQYAADKGVRVINISIGGPAPSQMLQSAVDYAWNKGALIFAAAMNNGASDPYYPAACNHVVAVTATDSYDHLASFSNYGTWVTISAPGVSILTTVIGGGYAYYFGTSFASPIVAGVAALSLAINPSLTNAELSAILEKSADDLGTPGYDASFGWGRVNAMRAVSAAKQALPAAPPAAPTYDPRRGATLDALPAALLIDPPRRRQ